MLCVPEIAPINMRSWLKNRIAMFRRDQIIQNRKQQTELWELIPRSLDYISSHHTILEKTM